MSYRKRQRPDAKNPSRQFNIKLFDDEKAFLLKAASQTRHKNLSYYILEAAIDRAEHDLNERLGDSNRN